MIGPGPQFSAMGFFKLGPSPARPMARYIPRDGTWGRNEKNRRINYYGNKSVNKQDRGEVENRTEVGCNRTSGWGKEVR